MGPWCVSMALAALAFLSSSLLPQAQVSGAQPEVTASIQNLRERPSSLYCSCNNIDGRELVFDLALTNRTAVPQQVYAFVWAANDEVSPPERGLWPLDAVESCLTETGELDVNKPSDGFPVEVPPGAAVVIEENAILQPIGWLEGEQVSFESLLLQLWSAEGELVFEAKTDLGS